MILYPVFAKHRGDRRTCERDQRWHEKLQGAGPKQQEENMPRIYVFTNLTNQELVARGFQIFEQEHSRSGAKLLNDIASLQGCNASLVYDSGHEMWRTAFQVVNEARPSIPKEVQTILDKLGKGNFFFSLLVPVLPLSYREFGTYHFRSASMVWDCFGTNAADELTAPDWDDLWEFLREFRRGRLLPDDSYETLQRKGLTSTFRELWRQFFEVLRLKISDMRYRLEHYSSGRD